MILKKHRPIQMNFIQAIDKLKRINALAAADAGEAMVGYRSGQFFQTAGEIPGAFKGTSLSSALKLPINAVDEVLDTINKLAMKGDLRISVDTNTIQMMADITLVSGREVALIRREVVNIF